MRKQSKTTSPSPDEGEDIDVTERLTPSPNFVNEEDGSLYVPMHSRDPSARRSASGRLQNGQEDVRLDESVRVAMKGEDEEPRSARGSLLRSHAVASGGEPMPSGSPRRARASPMPGHDRYGTKGTLGTLGTLPSALGASRSSLGARPSLTQLPQHGPRASTGAVSYFDIIAPTPPSPRPAAVPSTSRSVSKLTRGVLGKGDRLRSYVMYREWTYQFLERPTTWRAMGYHIFFLLLLSTTLALIILDTDPGVYIEPAVLESVEMALAANIIIEYPLRVWSAGTKLEYRGWRRIWFVLGYLMLVEALGMSNAIYTIICVAKGHADVTLYGFICRALLLSRVLRLERRMGSPEVLPQVLREHSHEIFFFATVSVIMVLTFAAVIYACEKNELNTKFVSLTSSLWFSVVSGLTVGYGDIVPVTAAGQAFTLLLLSIVVAVYAISPGIIGTSFALRYQQHKKVTRKRKHRMEAAAPLVQTWWREHALRRESPGTVKKFLADIVRAYDITDPTNNRFYADGGVPHPITLMRQRDQAMQSNELSRQQELQMRACLRILKLYRAERFRVAMASEEVTLQQVAEAFALQHRENQNFRHYLLHELDESQARMQRLEAKMDQLLAVMELLAADALRRDAAPAT